MNTPYELNSEYKDKLNLKRWNHDMDVKSGVPSMN